MRQDAIISDINQELDRITLFDGIYPVEASYELVKKIRAAVAKQNREREIRTAKYKKRMRKLGLDLDSPKGLWRQRVRTHKLHAKWNQRRIGFEARKYNFTL